ncbi:hypothetical protein MTo_03850 [Microcystis aeruginosa NIES-1211]|nr:hypothetical protein B5D77_21320 [Microcystis sp. MC19]GBL16526.1 hypothetical protein MTo_03850 [Microcystis aeruginosa NIES-1211]GCA90244.1 hypothetical protein MiTa_03602 [Microcystis aeruginosa NIES-4264]
MIQGTAIGNQDYRNPKFVSATDLTRREDIAPLDNPDVLAQLLAAKRSPRTRHAYAGDLNPHSAPSTVT